MLLLDTSGLLAYLDASTDEHVACRKVVEAWPGPFLLSPFVLAELDYLLLTRVGQRVSLALLDEVAAGAYRLEPFTSIDVQRARDVLTRNEGLKAGLADASLVVLAERHQTNDLLTLDQRHFRTLPGAAGAPFRILPADA